MVVPQNKLQLQYRRKSQTCPLVLTMKKLEKHSLEQPESRELLLSINCTILIRFHNTKFIIITIFFRHLGFFSKSCG